MEDKRTELLADRSERLRRRNAEFLGSQVRSRIAIVGDPSFLRTFDGQVTWATILNLVGRLYEGVDEIRIKTDSSILRLPRVFFPNSATGLMDTSLRLLRDLSEEERHYTFSEGGPPDRPDDSWVGVHVGKSDPEATEAISVASNGWLAFINNDAWQSLPESNNPIGPMVAGCMAAAEVYKKLYSSKVTSLSSLIFSAFDQRFHTGLPIDNPALPDPLDLPLVHIAGAGAGGMAVLFVLDSLPVTLRSRGIRLADRDDLDGTSFNRCILAVPLDEGKRKVQVAFGRVDAGRLGLEVFYEWWEDFVEQDDIGEQSNFDLVVSCVDRYAARRAVQYDRMPRVILTAGTTDFLFHVSRHTVGDGLACALCYQPPDGREPSCGKASETAQQMFEVAIEPSIGFVSVLAGVLLAAEMMKEIVPAWRESRISNTLRFQVLGPRVKIFARAKEPGCGCNSQFVAKAYRLTWPDTNAT
jgi:tRNA A37 threonylcarbamoyladenosine dehydratase